MTTLGFGSKNVIDIVKYRWYWLGFSALFLIPAIASMIYAMALSPNHSPLKLGIDFTGGTFLQYGFEAKITDSDIGTIRNILAQVGQENPVIQVQEATDIFGKIDPNAASQSASNQPANEAASNEQASNQPANEASNESSTPANDSSEKTSNSNSDTTGVSDLIAQASNEDKASNKETNSSVEEKSANESSKTEATNEEKSSNDTPSLTSEEDEKTIKEIKTEGQSIKVHSTISMRTKFLDESQLKKLKVLLNEKFGQFTILQQSAIGPSLGTELFKNSMVALICVLGGILIYLSLRFQADYAVCAIIALFHDALFIVGVFSFLGIVYNTEVDSLFVTGILTAIGFSVHDTIVVFDRLRENARFLSKKKSFSEIANDSVNQTLARSINTSLTTIIVLACLLFFGGSTTKDFVLTMLLGIIVGTYSSIFNASVLVTLWREINAPKKKRRATA